MPRRNSPHFRKTLLALAAAAVLAPHGAWALIWRNLRLAALSRMCGPMSSFLWMIQAVWLGQLERVAIQAPPLLPIPTEAGTRTPPHERAEICNARHVRPHAPKIRPVVVARQEKFAWRGRQCGASMILVQRTSTAQR